MNLENYELSELRVDRDFTVKSMSTISVFKPFSGKKLPFPETLGEQKWEFGDSRVKQNKIFGAEGFRG